MGMIAVACAAAAEQQPGGAKELISKAEAAKEAGDSVSAFQNYTEAVCALRLSGAPPENLAEYINERDRLAASLLSQVAQIIAYQKQSLGLQKGISAKLDKIAQIDRDVQARVKRNEDRIKNVETELLDAVQ